jgi:hypothetical protein
VKDSELFSMDSFWESKSVLPIIPNFRRYEYTLRNENAIIVTLVDFGGF